MVAKFCRRIKAEADQDVAGLASLAAFLTLIALVARSFGSAWSKSVESRLSRLQAGGIVGQSGLGSAPRNQSLATSQVAVGDGGNQAPDLSEPATTERECRGKDLRRITRSRS